MSRFQFVAHALGLPTGPAGKPEPPAVAPAPIPAADQPTKDQLIQLFDLLRLTPLFEAANKQLPEQIEQPWTKLVFDFFIDNPPFTPEREAVANKLVAQYQTLAQSAYPLRAMEDDIAAVYQAFLSADDVTAAIAYFGSASGQRLLNSQPAMLLAVPVIAGSIQKITEDMYTKLYDALKTALG